MCAVIVRYHPTQVGTPAPPFGTKHNKGKQPAFREKIQMESAAMGNGIQEGEVIRILNPYLIVTFPLRLVKLFIHFNCIFIHLRVLRILRLCPAQARLNPAYRTRGTEPPETLRVVRLDPRSDSLTAPLRL